MTAFLDATINASAGFTLTGCNDGCATQASASFAEYQFTFIGTGTDTIGFRAQTNPSEWYLDDISVVDTGTAAAPEPASLLLLAGGVASLVLVSRRRSRPMA